MCASLHVVPADDERQWSRWLDPVAHDFYHTAAYHRFSADAGEGEAWLAIYGSENRYLAWPYLCRRVAGDGDLFDVTSVYGYAGPLAYGCDREDPFLAQAHDQVTRVWRSQNVISVFTRFHPLLHNHSRTGSPCVIESGQTVSIDLAQPEGENWHEYQPSLRNRINRGRRQGLITDIDDRWDHLEDFVRLYQATMRRHNAASWYLFSTDYFRRLKQALGPHAFLFLARLHGRIAAAAILIEYRGIVQNHFCMNDEECLDLAPTKVLLDDARRWARARGNRVFHLGGGRGGARDSLFDFKAAFSKRRHAFFTGRWILAPGVYRRLCQRRACPAGGFFPAYRAPVEEPGDFSTRFRSENRPVI